MDNDKEVYELPVVTTLSSTDVFPVQVDPLGTPQTSQITKQNLQSALGITDAQANITTLQTQQEADEAAFNVEHNVNGTHKRIDRTTILTDAVTITFNLATLKKVFSVILGGDRTLAVANVQEGDAFLIRLTQDATGNRIPTFFNTIDWDGGLAPTLTTTGGKTDVFGFLCTSVVSGNPIFDGYVIAQAL